MSHYQSSGTVNPYQSPYGSVTVNGVRVNYLMNGTRRWNFHDGYQQGMVVENRNSGTRGVIAENHAAKTLTYGSKVRVRTLGAPARWVNWSAQSLNVLDTPPRFDALDRAVRQPAKVDRAKARKQLVSLLKTLDADDLGAGDA